jgi:glutathione S-transferase
VGCCAAMADRLYVLPGSHPSRSAALMLEYKGIPYKRIDLVPVMSKVVLRALRFPDVTVPALKIEGRRLQGSREISRALDEIKPDPPLFPEDSTQRRAVEEAERWGDEVLQPIPRRLSWWCIKRDNSGVKEFVADAKLGLPTSIAVATTPPIARLSARFNKSTDENVEADLAALPGMLDNVDRLIAEGLLNGEALNAADFQIATSLALLRCFEDLRPWIDSRPAGELVQRVVPDYPGRIPAVLPDAWLKAGRSAVPAA